MLWFIGFIIIFTVGGVAGVLMSIPAVDFQVHNSLFLVAHFHMMIVGGVVFGYFAGITYWFPKVFGFKLNERLGKYAFWCWFVGFLLAFVPLYILGLMGATRRLDHYDASLGWQQLFIVAGVGVAMILLGVGFQILQFIVSIKDRKKNIDATGDPWNGRTLEWATSSPPKVYNFAHIPEVQGRDAWWAIKHTKQADAKNVRYESIRLPKNTPFPLFIAGLAFVVGFALVWHIWWLALLGALGIIACIIVRTSDEDTERVITAGQVKKMETAL
jgi:cytochrome o ubiquinol oxidase subunit 1